MQAQKLCHLFFPVDHVVHHAEKRFLVGRVWVIIENFSCLGLVFFHFFDCILDPAIFLDELYDLPDTLFVLVVILNLATL